MYGVRNTFQGNTQSVYRHIQVCCCQCFKMYQNPTKVFNLLQSVMFLNMNLCSADFTQQYTGSIFGGILWGVWSFRVQFQTAVTLIVTSFFLEKMWILPIELAHYKECSLKCTIYVINNMLPKCLLPLSSTGSNSWILGGARQISTLCHYHSQ